jgi:hypothetical protein
MLMVLMGSTGACISYAKDNKGNEKPPVKGTTYFGLPKMVGSIHVPTVLAFTAAAPVMTIAGARLSKSLPNRQLKFALVGRGLFWTSTSAVDGNEFRVLS